MLDDFRGEIKWGDMGSLRKDCLPGEALGFVRIRCTQDRRLDGDDLIVVQSNRRELRGSKDARKATVS